jgi:hypothetical protein
MGSVTEHSTALKQSHRVLTLALLCGAGLAAWFIVHNVFFYWTYTPENFSPYYWPRRYGLVVHISCGALALTVGLIQLWLGLTLANKVQSAVNARVDALRPQVQPT